MLYRLIYKELFWVVLSPYLYDRKETFYRHENKYHLFKYGVEYTVIAHRKKLNLSLLNVGQMKSLVNSSKNLVLLMIKSNVDVDYEAFNGCNSKLKADLVDVVNHDDEVFQKAGISSQEENPTWNTIAAKCLLFNIDMH